MALVVASLATPRAAAAPMRPWIAASGEAYEDRFGFSVAGAGDFNGDGYPDVIVAAYTANANMGRAYMFFGGPRPDSIPDLVFDVLEPLQYPYANLGWSVAGAGDMNGDGFSDVIIGAPSARPLSDTSALGMAFVYFGGPVPDAVPDLVLKAEHNGTFSNASFGRSVAGAGDVNGDGFDDVIVGAPGQRRGSHPDIGSAYVFFGGPGADDRPDMTFNGELESDQMGMSVSGAGDVNSDGYADLIAGGPQQLDPPGPGRGWVFFGGPGADQTADLVVSGEVNLDTFGSVVASAGDVNGDGFDDVIVGAPRHQEGNNYGRAYVYFGGTAPGAAPGLVLTGTSSQFLGTSVAPASDVNGDGYDDVMTGSMFGPVDIFYGGPSPDAVPDLVIEYPSPPGIDQQFGYSIALVGDMNGNGHGDIAVGAPESYTNAVPTGRAYVFDFFATVLAVGPPPPARFEFASPWPNPATSEVRLALTIPTEGRVRVSVHDVSGREVARPIAGERLSGRVSREWRPSGLPSGIYFVRARVEGREQVRKLVWAGSR